MKCRSWALQFRRRLVDTQIVPSLLHHALGVLVTNFILASVALAGPGAVRLAVGPFFAPIGNPDLRRAADILPELLEVEMSGHARFQLVERQKIAAVCSELDLNSARLVSRATVAQLGKVLECDWLLSGSLVQSDGRTFVWSKVIDVRDGTIVDLFSEPYRPGVVTNIVPRMAAFLDRAREGALSKPREFVAMGPIVDMNPPDGPRREDWSRRIASRLEKHFVDAGYGMTEIAAIGPIFEERRLETAGLTGNPDGRVRLQSAFWLIDGGCEWVEGTPLTVSVTLRVQRVGGREQLLRLTNTPARIESDLTVALARALADGPVAPSTVPDAEADLLMKRGREFAERRSPFHAKPSVNQGNTAWDNYKRQMDQRQGLLANRKALMANYERLCVQNPDNTEAKMMLAYCWIGESDPALQERALQMFREIAANKKEPKWSASAERILTDERMMGMMRGRADRAMPRPKDWHSLHMAFQENPNDPEIKYELGAALLGSPQAQNQERGRQLLSDVAAGTDSVQAERARKALDGSKSAATN